jgi:hypothetical protein
VKTTDQLRERLAHLECVQLAAALPQSGGKPHAVQMRPAGLGVDLNYVTN